MVIGIDRELRHRAAGLKTHMLVCLGAASVTLLALQLDTNASRVVQGVVTGIGFIGAGAIIRRGDVVQGVTTAATIWVTTMIGMIFGAGLFGFGAALTVLTFAVVWGLKLVEPKLRRDHRAALTLTIANNGPSDEAIRRELEAEKFTITVWSVSYSDEGKERKVRADLEWLSKADQSRPPLCVEKLGRLEGVKQASWWPRGAGEVANL
jgi:putative Mg2+ transporter-C (MgtC) family protein